VGFGASCDEEQDQTVAAGLYGGLCRVAEAWRDSYIVLQNKTVRGLLWRRLKYVA
jgi:hypothetical protein